MRIEGNLPRKGRITHSVDNLQKVKVTRGEQAQEPEFTPKAPSFFHGDQQAINDYYSYITGGQWRPAEEREDKSSFLDIAVKVGFVVLGAALAIHGQPVLGGILAFGGLFLGKELLNDD